MCDLKENLGLYSKKLTAPELQAWIALCTIGVRQATSAEIQKLYDVGETAVWHRLSKLGKKGFVVIFPACRDLGIAWVRESWDQKIPDIAFLRSYSHHLLNPDGDVVEVPMGEVSGFIRKNKFPVQYFLRIDSRG